MTKIFIKNTFVDIDVKDLTVKVTAKDREKFLEKYPLVKKNRGASSINSWLQRKIDKDGMLRDFMKYLEATNHSPQMLYDLNEDYGDTFAEELLEAFQVECDKVFIEGFSQVFSITTTVKSFYKYMGKQLARGRGTYVLRRVHEKADFDRTDFIPFVDNQSVQFKAIVATLSSFPLRLGAFLKMQWKDVKEIFDDNIDLPSVSVPPDHQKRSIRKLKIEQSSFLHSWARKSLLEWRKEYQKIAGKKIDISNPVSLENPLWVTNQHPLKSPSKDTVEKWFRDRSKEYGKRITPHSFRAFFNTVLRCNTDLKSVFMGQTGRYNGSYIQKGSVLYKMLKEAFLESSLDLNPLSDDKFKTVRKKLRHRLSGYGIPEEEITELARSMIMGLMQMDQMFEKQQKVFIERFYGEVEKKLDQKRESRIIRERKKKQQKKIKPEDDFPFTKASWKGIHKEDEKPDFESEENLEAHGIPSSAIQDEEDEEDEEES